MIIYIMITLVVGFLIGWAWRDSRWRRAAKKNEFMVIDGKLYTVKEHINEHTGGG
jgi:hypothetical protein